ncbi:MAG TPA: ATP-binding protein, partial [Labilithrix sp.]|nr:ATP-binding protein [Labilithrix sp.]
QPVMAISMSSEQLRDLARIAPVLVRLSRGEIFSLTALERSTLAELGEDLPELAETLSSCATFMSELMHQMREFQRRDTSPSSSAEVAPLPVVKLALTMCRSGSMTSGSKLFYEGPSELPRVQASSADLLQILINLVRNAQQALEEHAIRHGVVSVEARLDSSRLFITVRDNGPGIPTDILMKLGTPFFTTRGSGTGLGIAQVKRLVGRLGGEIRIDSTPGQGTAVRFSLPTLPTT